MLKELAIENYAIFESLVVEFGRGLNVLTGETGTGKSLLVGAIGLLLGAKADKNVVRLGKNSARIEAVFALDSNLSIALSELGMEDIGDGIILAREIFSSSRSRFFTNGRLCSAALASEAAKKLVQIYGQSEHQTLLDPQKHTQILDEFAGAAATFQRYRLAYQELLGTKGRLAELEKKSQEIASRAGYLKFVISEIERASPKPKEDEEIESKRERAKFAGKLKELSQQIERLTYSKAGSATEIIGKARDVSLEASRIDPKGFEKIAQDLESALAVVEDVGMRAANISSALDFDEDELNRIAERWDAINRLKRKYGGSLEKVFETLEQHKRELSTLEHSGVDKRVLEEALARAEKDATKIAIELSKKRDEGANALVDWMRKELKELALENGDLKIEFIPEDGLGPFGKERVRFLFAPNPGEGFRELNLIASGGELSRLMLALKSAATRTDGGLVLIFDEVDAGIGGRVAERVGKRLKDLSASHQILNVTHQAQIAKFADAHISVSKEVKGQRTFGQAKKLSKIERETELARMLAGEKITERAIQHAREMLKAIQKGE